MDFHILDVFAETPLAGNQLAVVLDAGQLSRDERQALAREFNFSETTFVCGRPAAAGTKVHIHTPVGELPFAGHPTLGTAWVLLQQLASGGAEASDVVLDLAVGPVPVQRDDQGVLWFTAPPVTFGPDLAADQVVARLGLPVAGLASHGPCVVADVGPKFLLVPLRQVADLQHAALPSGDAVDADGVLFFVLPGDMSTGRAKDNTAEIHARMLFDVNGVREDPATGSANACLAAWLRRHQPQLRHCRVHQGEAMQRPSLLRLAICPGAIQVGGRVQPVARGRLLD